jgi:hypothetical protein
MNKKQKILTIGFYIVLVIIFVKWSNAFRNDVTNIQTQIERQKK